MFGLERGQSNVTFSLAYAFDFITESASKNYMDVPKVHERFFNSRGEMHGDKYSVRITLSAFYALMVMASVGIGFWDNSKIYIFILCPFSKV